MFKVWVDTKKYRNKLSVTFMETRVHDCFNKEQKNMLEYVSADELFKRISAEFPSKEYPEAIEFLNRLENILTAEK